MKRLNRAPDGSFMAPEASVPKWLPLMMSWVYHDPLTVTLDAIVFFCVGRWKEEYRILHSSLDWYDAKTTGHFQTVKHNEALKWLRKRDILIKAIADIKAVDEVKADF